MAKSITLGTRLIVLILDLSVCLHTCGRFQYFPSKEWMQFTAFSILLWSFLFLLLFVLYSKPILLAKKKIHYVFGVRMMHN